MMWDADDKDRNSSSSSRRIEFPAAGCCSKLGLRWPQEVPPAAAADMSVGSISSFSPRSSRASDSSGEGRRQSHSSTSSGSSSRRLASSSSSSVGLDAASSSPTGSNRGSSSPECSAGRNRERRRRRKGGSSGADGHSSRNSSKNASWSGGCKSERQLHRDSLGRQSAAATAARIAVDDSLTLKKEQIFLDILHDASTAGCGTALLLDLQQPSAALSVAAHAGRGRADADACPCEKAERHSDTTAVASSDLGLPREYPAALHNPSGSIKPAEACVHLNEAEGPLASSSSPYSAFTFEQESAACSLLPTAAAHGDVAESLRSFSSAASSPLLADATAALADFRPEQRAPREPSSAAARGDAGSTAGEYCAWTSSDTTAAACVTLAACELAAPTLPASQVSASSAAALGSSTGGGFAFSASAAAAALSRMSTAPDVCGSLHTATLQSVAATVPPAAASSSQERRAAEAAPEESHASTAGGEVAAGGNTNSSKNFAVSTPSSCSGEQHQGAVFRSRSSRARSSSGNRSSTSPLRLGGNSRPRSSNSSRCRRRRSNSSRCRSGSRVGSNSISRGGNCNNRGPPVDSCSRCSSRSRGFVSHSGIGKQTVVRQQPKQQIRLHRMAEADVWRGAAADHDRRSQACLCVAVGEKVHQQQQQLNFNPPVEVRGFSFSTGATATALLEKDKPYRSCCRSTASAAVSAAATTHAAAATATAAAAGNLFSLPAGGCASAAVATGKTAAVLPPATPAASGAETDAQVSPAAAVPEAVTQAAAAGHVAAPTAAAASAAGPAPTAILDQEASAATAKAATAAAAEAGAPAKVKKCKAGRRVATATGAARDAARTPDFAEQAHTGVSTGETTAAEDAAAAQETLFRFLPAQGSLEIRESCPRTSRRELSEAAREEEILLQQQPCSEGPRAAKPLATAATTAGALAAAQHVEEKSATAAAEELSAQRTAAAGAATAAAEEEDEENGRTPAAATATAQSATTTTAAAVTRNPAAAATGRAAGAAAVGAARRPAGAQNGAAEAVGEAAAEAAIPQEQEEAAGGIGAAEGEDDGLVLDSPLLQSPGETDVELQAKASAAYQPSEIAAAADVQQESPAPPGSFAAVWHAWVRTGRLIYGARRVAAYDCRSSCGPTPATAQHHRQQGAQQHHQGAPQQQQVMQQDAGEQQQQQQSMECEAGPAASNEQEQQADGNGGATENLCGDLAEQAAAKQKPPPTESKATVQKGDEAPEPDKRAETSPAAASPKEKSSGAQITAAASAVASLPDGRQEGEALLQREDSRRATHDGRQSPSEATAAAAATSQDSDSGNSRCYLKAVISYRRFKKLRHHKNMPASFRRFFTPGVYSEFLRDPTGDISCQVLLHGLLTAAFNRFIRERFVPYVDPVSEQFTKESFKAMLRAWSTDPTHAALAALHGEDAQLHRGLLDFFILYVTERLFFLLDPWETGRVAAADLLAFDEFQKLIDLLYKPLGAPPSAGCPPQLTPQFCFDIFSFLREHGFCCVPAVLAALLEALRMHVCEQTYHLSAAVMDRLFNSPSFHLRKVISISPSSAAASAAAAADEGPAISTNPFDGAPLGVNPDPPALPARAAAADDSTRNLPAAALSSAANRTAAPGAELAAAATVSLTSSPPAAAAVVATSPSAACSPETSPAAAAAAGAGEDEDGKNSGNEGDGNSHVHASQNRVTKHRRGEQLLRMRNIRTAAETPTAADREESATTVQAAERIGTAATSKATATSPSAEIELWRAVDDSAVASAEMGTERAAAWKKETEQETPEKPRAPQQQQQGQRPQQGQQQQPLEQRQSEQQNQQDQPAHTDGDETKLHQPQEEPQTLVTTMLDVAELFRLLCALEVASAVWSVDVTKMRPFPAASVEGALHYLWKLFDIQQRNAIGVEEIDYFWTAVAAELVSSGQFAAIAELKQHSVALELLDRIKPRCPSLLTKEEFIKSHTEGRLLAMYLISPTFFLFFDQREHVQEAPLLPGAPLL